MTRHRAATTEDQDNTAVAVELIDLLCVIITVTCECGNVIGQYIDTIAEKYPFYCEVCDDDKRTGKYPWSLTTQITGKAKTYAVNAAAGTVVPITPPQENTSA